METVGSFHGLPGLYVSGVFSAALRYLIVFSIESNTQFYT